MFKIILEDLKTEFPGTKTLTLKQVSTMLSKSRGALYKLKKREHLTLPFIKEGGRYVVTIYALAKWLSEMNAVEEVPIVESEKPKKLKVSGVKASTVSGQPVFRGRAPLSKTLFNCFASSIQQLRDEVDFYSEIFRELETIELERCLPVNIKTRTRPRPIL